MALKKAVNPTMAKGGKITALPQHFLSHPYDLGLG